MRRRAAAAVLLIALAGLAGAERAGAIAITGTVTGGVDPVGVVDRHAELQPDAERRRPDADLHAAGPGDRPARHGRRLEPDRHLDPVQRRVGTHVPDDRVLDHGRVERLRRQLDVHDGDELRQLREPDAAVGADRSRSGQVLQRRRQHGHGQDGRQRNRRGRGSRERLRGHVLEYRDRVDRLRPVITRTRIALFVGALAAAAPAAAIAANVVAITPPASASFAVTLDGTDKTGTYSLAIPVSYTSNGNNKFATNGWHITATSTTFKGNTTLRTLPTTASTITSFPDSVGCTPGQLHRYDEQPHLPDHDPGGDRRTCARHRLQRHGAERRRRQYRHDAGKRRHPGEHVRGRLRQHLDSCDHRGSVAPQPR